MKGEIDLSNPKAIAELSAQVTKWNDVTVDPAAGSGDGLGRPAGRKGVERFAAMMATLAAKYGVRSAAFPITQIESDVANLNQLEPLSAAVKLLDHKIDVALRLRRSRVYVAITTYYTTLRSLAHGNSDLQVELRPFVAFMARPRHKSAANGDVGHPVTPPVITLPASATAPAPAATAQ